MSQARLLSPQHSHLTSHRWCAAKALLLKAKLQQSLLFWVSFLFRCPWNYPKTAWKSQDSLAQQIDCGDQYKIEITSMGMNRSLHAYESGLWLVQTSILCYIHWLRLARRHPSVLPPNASVETQVPQKFFLKLYFLAYLLSSSLIE